jgi:hypothetical protein
MKEKSSCSGLENREYDRRDPSRGPRSTLCPQKLAPTSPTSGGRSVGLLRSRTQATQFSFSDIQLTDSVGMAMGYGLNDQGSIPCRDKIFLFSTEARPAVGPTGYGPSF